MCLDVKTALKLSVDSRFSPPFNEVALDGPERVPDASSAKFVDVCAPPIAPLPNLCAKLFEEAIRDKEDAFTPPDIETLWSTPEPMMTEFALFLSIVNPFRKLAALCDGLGSGENGENVVVVELCIPLILSCAE